MSSPEVARITVSIEVRGGLEPDVATIYQPIETVGAPDQLSFDDPIQATGSPMGRPLPSAVPITPQGAGDQRIEIRESSVRNNQLMILDERIGSFNSRNSEIENARIGRTRHRYSSGQLAGLEQNMNRDKNTATESFAKACGSCALDCQIRDQYPKWARVHAQAKGPSPAGQESRDRWRRRLLADPSAPCLPPK